MRFLPYLLTALLLLPACGRKGPLIPPEALVPAAVSDLKVVQSGDALRISWSAPGKEKGGRPLRDLAGFTLFKRIIAGDGTDCASCPDSWHLLADIAADNPGAVKKSGSTFITYDKETPAGKTSQFRLLATSKSGGISAPATSPLVTFQPPIAPPRFTLEVLPGSIKLEFAFEPTGAGRLAGFNVYRRSDAMPPPLLPLNKAPLPGKVWEDMQVQFGSSYLYSVTALVEVNGALVESFRSAESAILFTLQELR